MDNAKIFPKPIYDQLREETQYNCEGSCTCKFLKDRSDYDRLQIQAFQTNKNYDIVPQNTKDWLR